MHGNAWRFLVGGLEMFGCGRNMQVILYDEEQMQSFGGYLSGVTRQEPEQIDITTLEDTSHRVIRGMSNISTDITIELTHEIIQLDPTTMKRIAKHNLEKENERLLKEIEKNKKEIEDLKETYKSLQERLQAISDIGSDIWENGTKYIEKEEYEESDWNDYD